MGSPQTRILVTTPLYPPQVGGPATRAYLFEHKLPSYGFEVSVVKFGDVLRLPKVIRHIAYFILVCIRGFGTDVFIAQDPVSTGLPVFCAAKLLRKKLILFVVGDYAWEQGVQRAGVKDSLDIFVTKYMEYPLFVRVLKKVERYVASHSDAVVVPSRYLKSVVSKWGVSQDKVTVIYNSFNASEVLMQTQDGQNAHGQNGKSILSVGRLVPWKGFETLIRGVMPIVLKTFPDATLSIVGDGPQMEVLRNLITECGLVDSVHLVGKKPQKELFEYIRESQIFVLNTAYEGMSHQLLEVMALGTPIVASDIESNTEVIDSGVNGLLVSLNNEEKIAEAILRLLSDPSYGAQLASAGKKKILSFSEEKMFQAFTELVHSIVRK